MFKLLISISLFLAFALPSPSLAGFDTQYNATSANSITAFDAVKTKFSDRLQSFITDMRTISLFSIVSSLDIEKNGFTPPGAEGAITVIELGQYGGATNFDFSAVIPPFSIALLRSIIILLTLFASLTFIVKTGGS